MLHLFSRILFLVFFNSSSKLPTIFIVFNLFNQPSTTITTITSIALSFFPTVLFNSLHNSFTKPQPLLRILHFCKITKTCKLDARNQNTWCVLFWEDIAER